MGSAPCTAACPQLPAGSGGDDRLATADDRTLMAAVCRRDPEALGELFRRFGGVVLSFAQRILADEQEAEEVLQEVFLYAWRRSHGYDSDRASLSTWLVLIARSRSIDRLRTRQVVRRAVDQASHEPEPEEGLPAEDRVLRSERRRRLREELAALPEEQREVIDLAYFRGLTQTEIAASTGIPLGTVKTRTLLAMRKLRQGLAAEVESLL
jgi:RNA polymerase sigma factor (sigma-70 family)